VHSPGGTSLSASVVAGRVYRGYVLSVLMLITTVSYLDTGLIMLLLQPIKDDLHLSDTQLGVLNGIAVGVIPAVVGLLVARWADRGNRVSIICLAAGLWAVAVMSCMFVFNFVQLLSVRVAAGIAQSGCATPTYSLLGNYFLGAADRTRAMAMYWGAGQLSSILSMVLGGWLSEHYGWRATFFLMGMPAIFIVVLAKKTIKEPRSQRGSPECKQPQSVRSTEVLRGLWRQPSSKYLVLAITLMWISGMGLGPWYSVYLMRVHGMHTGELGVWLGMIFGVGGAAGSLFGGYVASRWRVEDERFQARLRALTIAAQMPLFLAFILSPGRPEALGTLVPLIFISALYVGPAFALLQRLVVDEARATAYAVVMLFANVIGMGVGPQVIGLLSDVMTPVFGFEAVRYSMLCMSPVMLLAAYCFWRVGATVDLDLAALQRLKQAEGLVDLRSSASDRPCRVVGVP